MLRTENAFHTGFVVPDIDAAVAEFSATFITRWTDIADREIVLRGPEGPFTLAYRVAYSTDGPHRFELISSVPGTMWEATTNPATGVIAAHHTGFWSSDVPGDSQALVDAGCPLLATIVHDGRGAKYLAYHRMSNGTLIELVDDAIRPGLEFWWEFGGPFPARPA